MLIIDTTNATFETPSDMVATGKKLFTPTFIENNI